MINTNLIIDKSNWKPVKFGDVVFEPKEVCKDILSEGIKHVVGLEHIDTGDIHLRKSETIEVSTTFSKKFRKADVLFGRRRAYLKKAAQAKFDGICSGDITVFRSKKELSPLLLPFIVSNDKFFDYSVKHSAGGLSPRVKFKDLSNFKLLLPPKDEQVRIAGLLWAIQEVIEKQKVLLNKMELLFKSLLKEVFSNDSSNNTKLKTLVDLSTGKRMKGGGLKTGDVLSIGGENINNDGELIFEKNVYISKEFFDSMKSGVINQGDILMMKDGAKTGKVAFVSNQIKAATNEHLFIIRSNSNKLNQKFLFYFFLSDSGQNQISNLFHGIIGGVTREDVYELQLPLYNENMQLKFVKKLDFLMHYISLIKLNIASTHSLQKSIINQIF